MSSPKHYSTYKVAQTSALARSLDVSDQEAVTDPEHSILLCKGYGVIAATAATAEYFIQFLRGPELPAEGVVTHFVGSISVNHTLNTVTAFDFDFGPEYVKCKSGLWIVASTARYLKTIVTSDMLHATVFYLKAR